MLKFIDFIKSLRPYFFSFNIFITTTALMILITWISVTWWGICLHIHYAPLANFETKSTSTSVNSIINNNNSSNNISSNRDKAIANITNEYLMKYKPRIVFSLTTSPKRLESLGETLQSLFNQEIQPDMIQINLPHSFKRTGEIYSTSLLESLKFLNDPLVHINRCEDLGPATKLMPTVLSESTVGNTLIIVVDDDTVYSNQLVKVFTKLYLLYPKNIIVGNCGDTYLTNSNSQYNNSNAYDRCRMFEAYAGVGFHTSLFHSDFIPYMEIALRDDKCFRSDDYVVSNYFALHDVYGVSSTGLLTGCKQLESGKGKDALHQLEWAEANHDVVYGKCAKYLSGKNLAVLKIKAPHIRTWSELIPRRYKERMWDIWKSFWQNLC